VHSESSASGAASPAHRTDIVHGVDLLAGSHITNISVHWQQLHNVFLETYMPRNGLGTSAKVHAQVDGNWILQLRGGVIDSPALQTSIAAFAAAHLAHENNDDTLVKQSREMYMRSLQHLRAALATKRTRLSDETLAACLALSMYELAESPAAGADEGGSSSKAGNGYTTHLMGAMMLMEMRGPDLNNSPLAHSLFLGLRRYVLLSSLMNRRVTFISQPQWRDRPWAVYPKNTLDVCLDSLFEMPAVLQQWDQVLSETDGALMQQKCHAVIARCNELDATLRDWYAQYQQSHAGPLYRTAFCTLQSKTDSVDHGKVFPTCYHFPVFSVGYVLVTHWSGCMIVNDIAMAAQYKLAYANQAASSATAAMVAARKHTGIWMQMIRNLCQSVEYFLGQEMGRIGPTTALGILQGCLASLSGGRERREREQGWIVEMMGRAGKRLNLKRHDLLWK
jgi:hypothetical protein